MCLVDAQYYVVCGAVDIAMFHVRVQTNSIENSTTIDCKNGFDQTACTSTVQHIYGMGRFTEISIGDVEP